MTQEELKAKMQQLLDSLKRNCAKMDEIEKIQENKTKLEEMSDEDRFELNKKEFSLAIENSKLYETIFVGANKYENLWGSDLEIRRMLKSAESYLRASIID